MCQSEINDINHINEDCYIIGHKLVIQARDMGMEYYSHEVFDLLNDMKTFYECLSERSADFAKALMVTDHVNFDNIIYSSIKGSMESISILIYSRKLNDAYTLIRKYRDAIITDVYTSIPINDTEKSFLEKGLSKEARKVRAWAMARTRLYQSYDEVKNIIKSRDEKLFKILENAKDSKIHCQRCNDNVHYNSLYDFSLNDLNRLIFEKDKWLEELDTISSYLNYLLCYHFSYIYLLSPCYYVASDYVDALECGQTPDPNATTWVAPIFQEIFDKRIKTFFPELADYLKTIGNLDLK